MSGEIGMKGLEGTPSLSQEVESPVNGDGVGGGGASGMHLQT